MYLAVVNGAIDINQTNFKLAEGSPAIDAGNPNYSPSNRYSMENLDQQILQMQFHIAVLKILQMDGHNLVHQ